MEYGQDLSQSLIVLVDCFTCDGDVVDMHFNSLYVFQQVCYYSAEYLWATGDAEWKAFVFISSEWCDEGRQFLAPIVEFDVPKPT